MADLKIFTFGGLRFEQDGKASKKAGSRKVQAMLVYLALTQRAVPRELLAELLWDNLSQQRAMSNLRRELTGLRQTYGAFVTIDRERVVLNRDTPLWIDAQQLQNGLTAAATLTSESAKQLEEAIVLYQGELLAGFQVRDASGFETWLLAEREHWQKQAISALERLVAFATADQIKDYDKGLRYSHQLLRIDPLREQTHRQLMRLLALTDRRTDALNQYESCRKLLWNELGVTPAPETEALFAEIYDGRLTPDVERDVVVTNPPPPKPRHNLPTQPTPFVGRETELAALEALFANESTRLITIVGPGGMGKTRLALAFAERQVKNGRFPSGVYFVNLAPISEARHIVPTLAAALDYHLLGSSDDASNQQQILNYLRRKQMLLIFDNFEHLLDGAVLLSEIAQVASHVQILATSRERLQLRQEQIYSIVGLEFPNWETPEDATEYTAVQLFLQSARRNQPDFTLVAGELTYLTRICRLVAGMPLAIELAAAWVDMLKLDEIAAELQQGLDILEGEMRDMPERHRSIRAAIEQSWQRLSSQERDIFRYLSVFRGGFTREAAQAVAGANLRQLARLVNKSFLQFDRENGRYHIHELMRQFGEEKLIAFGQQEAVRDIHRNYFLNFVHEREADIKGRRQLPAIREITADFENIHRAWFRAAKQKAYVAINLALDGLILYFMSQQLWAKAVAIQQETLLLLNPEPGQTPHPVWYRVAIRHTRPRHDEIPINEAALATAQRNNDQHETAYCLVMLGHTLSSTGNNEQGQQLKREGIDLLRKSGDPFMASYSLTLLGFGYYYDSPNKALRLCEESIAQLQNLGDTIFCARPMSYLGYWEWLRGNYVASEKRLLESSRLYRQAGRTAMADFIRARLVCITFLQGNLDEVNSLNRESETITDKDYIFDRQDIYGLAALLKGEYEQARYQFQAYLNSIGWDEIGEFLTYWGLAITSYTLANYRAAKQNLLKVLESGTKQQDKGAVMLSFPVAALLFARAGHPVKAIELLALAFRQLTGWTGWLEKWNLFTQLRTDLETACGETTFAEAWERGQRLSLWKTADSLLLELAESSQ